jgi:hypothetical protein
MCPGKGVLLILFVVFAACASNNNSTSTPPGSRSNAVQQASRSHTETLQSASGEKCVIDENRICEEGTPGMTNDPYYAAGSEIRERVASGDDSGGEASGTLHYTLSLLQGDRPVVLVCGVKVSQHKVTFGQLAKSGTPTDTDIAKLHAAGYCVE